MMLQPFSHNQPGLHTHQFIMLIATLQLSKILTLTSVMLEVFQSRSSLEQNSYIGSAKPAKN